jgi:hypothetical protein
MPSCMLDITMDDEPRTVHPEIKQTQSEEQGPQVLQPDPVQPESEGGDSPCWAHLLDEDGHLT